MQPNDAQAGPLPAPALDGGIGLGTGTMSAGKRQAEGKPQEQAHDERTVAQLKPLSAPALPKQINQLRHWIHPSRCDLDAPTCSG